MDYNTSTGFNHHSYIWPGWKDSKSKKRESAADTFEKAVSTLKAAQGSYSLTLDATMKESARFAEPLIEVVLEQIAHHKVSRKWDPLEDLRVVRTVRCRRNHKKRGVSTFFVQSFFAVNYLNLPVCCRALKPAWSRFVHSGYVCECTCFTGFVDAVGICVAIAPGAVY